MGCDVTWSGTQPDPGIQAECRDFLSAWARRYRLDHDVYDGVLRANVVKGRVGYVNTEEFCGAALYPAGREGLRDYNWPQGGVASVVFDRSERGLIALKPLGAPADQDLWFEPYLGGRVDCSLPTYLHVRDSAIRGPSMGVFGDLLRAVKACYVPNLELADDSRTSGTCSSGWRQDASG